MHATESKAKFAANAVAPTSDAVASSPYTACVVCLHAGLPTLKASAGFRVYDEFEDEFYFEYPKVWPHACAENPIA
jgi:hypothetical protein